MIDNQCFKNKNKNKKPYFISILVFFNAKKIPQICNT